MIPADECCEPDGAQSGISPALARRARAIERDLQGPHATEAEWRVLLGQEGGALPWAVTHRLLACLDAAADRPGAGLRCD